MKKKPIYGLYLFVIFLILSVPFVGMSFWATNETAEKSELVAWPKVYADGQWNTHYFQNLGSYFESHFAFKEDFVTLNSELRTQLFGSEANSRVIVGKEDWLFFNQTMNDYLGLTPLTDRELFMIAENLKLMQTYCESQGRTFLFVAPPNKNSLYASEMPERYLKAVHSNYDRLLPYLAAADVRYTDLKASFLEQTETLYFKRDTHWNTTGALLAYNELMQTLQLPHETYGNVPSESAPDHVGDIDLMLFPKNPAPEPDFRYAFQFTNDNQIADYMDPWITTSNFEKEHRLLMYRDSFGEKLAPFLANSFQKAYFSRYVPYDFNQLDTLQPTHVIVERAERNLSSLLSTGVPIMYGIAAEIKTGPELANQSRLKFKQEANDLVISGEVDKQLVKTQTTFFINLITPAGSVQTYRPFYTSNEDQKGNGYLLRIPLSAIGSEQAVTVQLGIEEQGVQNILKSQSFNLQQ